MNGGEDVAPTVPPGRVVAPGGWRRTVVGLLVGAAVGLLARRSMGGP